MSVIKCYTFSELYEDGHVKYGLVWSPPFASLNRFSTVDSGTLSTGDLTAMKEALEIILTRLSNHFVDEYEIIVRNERLQSEQSWYSSLHNEGRIASDIRQIVRKINKYAWGSVKLKLKNSKGDIKTIPGL